MSLQNFASALDHAPRKTGEAGNFDAVTFVCAAGLDTAQKNDLAGCFFDGDVNVFDRRQQIAKLRQFVIVRGKERARAGVLLEMLDDGPGDGKTIERGRSAADFIEENETRGSRVIQDGRDFAQFDEEGRAPAGEIVAGADARED